MKKIVVTLVCCLSAFLAFSKDSVFYFRTSDQVNLYVRIAGKGQPCLFVHGGPGSNSYYFEAMPSAKLIEQKLRMVYFDQRGSGRSDSALNNDYSLQRMEKDMEELRNALGIKKWLVMGHSFGGILMTNYANHFPSSVSGLMVIQGTLDMEASMKSHIAFGLKELAIKDPAPYLDTTKVLIERVGMVHNLLSEKDLWYRLMYRNAFEKKLNDSITLSAGKFNRDFASKVWGEPGYWKDFTPLSASIKCPVLVMRGEKDYAIGVDHYKSFRFPKMTVVHYIGGHAPFQEEPQWFAEKILEFVKKNFK